MPPVQELTVARPSVPAFTLPGVVVRHRVALIIAGLTLLTFVVPAAPTYDPWAWIIWGREILHLDLSTVEGPSWKPLPVLLTTPFALFGGLAPDLWLFVARAGAIAGVYFIFRLGRRLGGIPAGVIAAVPYALAPWTLRNGAMGNSEGLLVALAFASIDRHLDGRHRAAFVLAFGAALLRPEVWPLFGLYGLWLLWRRADARALVAGAFAALPALWLLPEWWGSGDLLRAAHRAQNPRANSPAFAENPIRAVLEQFQSMLTPVVWIGLAAFVLAIVLRRAPGRREWAIAAVLLAGAVLWVAEVAVMTSDGFSGNIRYLVLPAAIICLLAGTGVAWLAGAVLGPRAVMAGPVAIGLAVVAGGIFAAPAAHRVPADVEAVIYQARLNDRVGGVVARAGGAKRLLACGDPYTGPFQVPVVAWNLGIHTSQVTLEPARPAVVFRVQSNPGVRPGPSIERLGGESGVRTFATAQGWRIVGACRRAA
ncbi:MAG: hypothetical protein QOJ21_1007 [Solirubrobacteraceae bacterium]|jgi:hypothetical protein|nr:hypothetical protein [Solirubrobacteraceae bacterium]